MFYFFFSNSEDTGMGQVSSGRPWDWDWVMEAPRNPKYIQDRKRSGEEKKTRIHTREDIVSFNKKYRSTPY